MNKFIKYVKYNPFLKFLYDIFYECLIQLIYNLHDKAIGSKSKNGLTEIQSYLI